MSCDDMEICPDDPDNPPFGIGDVIEMRVSGYAAPVGQQGTVADIRWATPDKSSGYWVVHFRFKKNGWHDRPSNTVAYRASRFKLIKKAKGKEPMATNSNIIVIYEYLPDEATKEHPYVLTGNPIIFYMTPEETAVEKVKKLLKDNPTKRYIYGRLGCIAKVDAPPIKIENV